MNALQWINKRVKELQKKSPGRSRKALQKQAGREYREGKKSTGKKSVAKRKPTVRKRTARKKVSTATYVAPSELSSMSLASLQAAAKRKLNDQLDKAVVRRYHATRKTDKRKISKSINQIKANIRKFL